MDVASHLRIERIDAYRYRMPLKHAYGTARGRTTHSQNFIVKITASAGDDLYHGFGECQPRHVLTGDGEKDRSSAWDFLTHAVDTLVGARLSLPDREEAVQAIRDVMTGLADQAQGAAQPIHGTKPFRGTLLGIEVALLDVVARACGLRISELLGERRSEVEVSISTISTTTSADEVANKVERQVRFPMTRLKGGASLEGNLEILRQANEGNQRAGRTKPLWIDLNEALTFDEACEFIRAAADEMQKGLIPDRLTIEGPLPKDEGIRLAALQQYADKAAASSATSEPLVIEIMPDESLWDSEDLQALQEHGGCRALNIKAPKAGGLLASLDLAEAAVAANPEVKICIGGMLGTSELTAWALHNLARAMPRIDYVTTVPPRNVEPIAAPKSTYVAKGSSIIAAQTGTGLGTKVVLNKLRPYLMEQHTVGKVPQPAASAASKKTSAAGAKSPAARAKKESVPRESWHVIVHGKGLRRAKYREWLCESAQELKLAGWVRNREDGAVEALVRGRKRRISTLIAALEEGPSGAKVERVDYRESEIVPHAGMRIRPDQATTDQRTPVPALGRRILSKLRGKRPDVPQSVPSTREDTPGHDASKSRPGERPADVDPEASANLRPGSRPPGDGGVTLEALGNILGGSWVCAHDLTEEVGGGSFLIDRLPPKAVLYVMTEGTWSKRLRRSSHQIQWQLAGLVQAAAARGAVAAVSSEPIPDAPLPVHLVPDSREAMWKLAYFARERYTNPVVGITGTVGKSTTTSLLSHVLSQTMRVHSTDGNWNTIDGVTNTLSGLLPPSDVAVVEAAISGFVRVPGHSSAAMLQPDVAIITAIGSAHLDIAPTIEETARIKGKLLESIRRGGVAVLNADAPYFEYLHETALRAGAAKVLSFGRAASADFRLIDWTIDGNASLVTIEAEGRALSYRMRSVGEGVAVNSLGTLAAARALGCNAAEVVESFHEYVAKDDVTALHELPVNGGTALLIDDSTNATVISMKAAIELLGKLAAQRQGRAVAVLGQINFLGEQANQLHASLAESLREAGVKVLLTTGDGMSDLRSLLAPHSQVAHSETPRQLVSEVRAVLQPGDVVLVKGSSANTGFKRVARSLLDPQNL